MVSLSTFRGTILIQKVTAYITNGRRRLVFEHTEFPEAGVQVPGGSVEQDETPETAVMREAREESGLENLSLARYLGKRRFDWTEFGLDLIEERHFFHLHCPGQPAARWRHWELHPSQGPPEPIEFEFYWALGPDKIPVLAGNQGTLLSLIDWDSLSE